jgi:superfamily II DNA helicase RecQ
MKNASTQDLRKWTTCHLPLTAHRLLHLLEEVSDRVEYKEDTDTFTVSTYLVLMSQILRAKASAEVPSSEQVILKRVKTTTSLQWLSQQFLSVKAQLLSKNVPVAKVASFFPKAAGNEDASRPTIQQERQTIFSDQERKLILPRAPSTLPVAVSRQLLISPRAAKAKAKAKASKTSREKKYLAPPSFDELPATDKNLHKKLQNLRFKLWKQSSFLRMPSMVCTKRSLLEMAYYKPTSLDALVKVHDIGERRLKSFGTQFLQVIAVHLDNPQTQEIYPISVDNQRNKKRKKLLTASPPTPVPLLSHQATRIRRVRKPRSNSPSLVSSGDVSPKKPKADDIQADIKLHQLLVDYRRQQSKEKKLIPYQVYNDKMVKLLVAEKPTSLRHLAAVKGFGPTRIKKYGNEITNIIRRCGTKNTTVH